MPVSVPDAQTMQRLPLYMKYLKSLPKGPVQMITAKTVANALNMDVVLVRGDLAVLCPSEKRRVSYSADELLQKIKQYIHIGDVTPVVVVGAGKLGKALLGYGGFMAYGIDVVAAFDISPRVLARKDPSGKPVYHINELGIMCKRLNAKVGILAVPAGSAQTACDRLVKAGAIAIWNFTSADLRVPKGILLKNENLSRTLVQLVNYSV